MDVVIVSVTALEHQNADADSQVARVLRNYAGNRLSAEVERARNFAKKLRQRP